MSQSELIPLKLIPIMDRISMIFVYYGRIDVKDGAFAVIYEVDGEDWERKHIPGRFELGEDHGERLIFRDVR
jgi:CRISPR-associated protein Cas1